MIQLLKQARASSYRKVSLSVDHGNPAVQLYQKLGFKRLGIFGTSGVMIIDLK